MRNPVVAARSRQLLYSAVALFLLAGSIAALPAGAARPKCFGRVATIVGTGGDDELTGTKRSDVIVARRGSDVIAGRGGRDFICAGRGQFDVVFAGRGNDRINGGRGFDIIFPGPGDDFLNGGRFPFDYVAYEGSQIGVEVDLNEGTATGQGTDTLRGIEAVAGSEGDDVLIGTDDANDLWGYGGSDTIVAGDGDNFVNGGAGDDNVAGGAGFDFLDIAVSGSGPGIGDDVYTDAGAAVDLIQGTVSGGEGVGQDAISGIEGVGGTLGDDTMLGNDSFNVLIGFEGADTIDLGGAGEPDDLGTQNVADPGPGDDTVTGSPGTDVIDYSFGSFLEEPTGGATIDLEAGTATGPEIGNDVFSSIEYAVGTIFDDAMSGTPQPNLLIGLDGSDEINGGAGDDILDGDAFVFGVPFDLDGEDTLNGGAGTDTCLGGETTTDCESMEFSSAAARRARPMARHSLLTSRDYLYERMR